MKVTFSGNNHNQSLNSKPVVTTTLTTTSRGNTAPTTSLYEPKSVPELCGNPSPVAKKVISTCATANISTIRDDPLQLGDHALNHHFEVWDSLMRELGLDDDSIPVSKPISQLGTHCDQQYSSIPEFPPVSSFDSSTRFEPSEFSILSDITTTYSPAPLSHNSNIIHPFDLSGEIQNLNNNLNIGFDYVDELIRLAECFETNSPQLGQVSLAQLNQQLRSPTGKPLQRAAFYFKEALQSLLSGLTRQTHPASSSEIIQAIKAQKMFSGISPVPMFSSFMANQAVLEALEGSIHVHIIDFDIGLGSHWASYLKELADKAELGKLTPGMLRITAIVPEKYAMESKLIKENLTQFARELNIRLDIDFVSISTFEYSSFNAIKLMDSENVAVLLSPAIFRHVGTGFLDDLHRVSPLVVVYVESEGQTGFEAPSFRQTLIDGLDFYSSLFESLEAANFKSSGGCSVDWIRRIETSVLLPKIMEAVEAASRRNTPWKEALVAAGLRQVGLSQFADFQAECLLRRANIIGFHVAKQQEEMLLCWHNRPLVATSAWRY
ncbi:scarecrow-like protein 15 [Olea europaea var. sylvestris]|uniref:scarecrow-like protein 15 n=1 Tax=Olea europaea var. sylvestris TaxID=158386 RepID=UPI000C1CE0F3|nr:scarecrow-like protein 15 [Olea europaea var. sylvestris]